MQHQSPHQCDICFQPYSPFATMRVLPVTSIIALSGTATPIHVRTSGAKISICRHCRQSYSNLEPWTDPANSPDIPDTLDSPDSLATSGSPDTPDPLDPSDAPSLSLSQPVPESGTRLADAQPLLTLLANPHNNDLCENQDVEPATCPAHHSPHPQRLCMAVPTPILPSHHPGSVMSASHLSVPYTFHFHENRVTSATSASSVSLPIYHRIRPPPSPYDTFDQDDKKTEKLLLQEYSLST